MSNFRTALWSLIAVLMGLAIAIPPVPVHAQTQTFGFVEAINLAGCAAPTPTPIMTLCLTADGGMYTSVGAGKFGTPTNLTFTAPITGITVNGTAVVPSNGVVALTIPTKATGTVTLPVQ